jgi:hypothetical protein
MMIIILDLSLEGQGQEEFDRNQHRMIGGLGARAKKDRETCLAFWGL